MPGTESNNSGDAKPTPRDQVGSEAYRCLRSTTHMPDCLHEWMPKKPSAAGGKDVDAEAKTYISWREIAICKEKLPETLEELRKQSEDPKTRTPFHIDIMRLWDVLYTELYRFQVKTDLEAEETKDAAGKVLLAINELLETHGKEEDQRLMKKLMEAWGTDILNKVKAHL